MRTQAKKYPKTLVQIAKYLESNPPRLGIKGATKRTRAADNEKIVLKEIKKKFVFEEAPESEWYDFLIRSGKNPCPVNIKISNLKGADNTNCKLGIYYTLTGIWPEFSNSIKWESFFKKLSADLKSNTKTDYYFLVLANDGSGKVFLNSLLGLSKITPNGNNLPFQCNWSLNSIPQNNTFMESRKMILTAMHESVKKRAKIQSEYEAALKGKINATS